VRLHGQIAEALEKLYGNAADGQAAELALHYAESAVLNRAHARQAAHYSRLAAEQAAAQFAWDEAIRHYERCLAITAEAPDRLGEDEAALWFSLALVQRYAGTRYGDAVRSFDRAAALYRERADAWGEARTWTAMARVGVQPLLHARLELLDGALAALDGGDSAERCALLAARAYGELEATGDPFAAEAEAMAERLGLSGALYPWSVLRRSTVIALDRGRFAEVLELGPRLHERMAAAGVLANVPLALATYAATFLGDLTRAQEVRDAYLAYLRRQRDRGVELIVLTIDALTAWRRGEQPRHADALALTGAGSFQGAMLEAEVALAAGGPATALRLCPTVDHPDASGNGVIRTHGVRSRIFVALDDPIAGRRELEAWAVAWRSDVLPQIVDRTAALASLGEAVCEFGESLRGELLAYLGRYPLMRSLPSHAANPDDLRGRLALSLGRVDEAEQHFRTGLDWASRPDVRYLVDAGRCHQGLADVAEQRGDHALAMEHLDAAGELFSKHGGAKLYLDQVIAKKQILKA